MTIDLIEVQVPGPQGPLASSAVEAALGAIEADTGSIDGKLPALSSGRVPVDGSGVTQPVSAASLPLPAGAATAAKQDTLIAAVDGVEGLLTTIDTDLGAPADAAATTDTGTFSLIALFKRGLQNWSTLLGRIPALQSGAVPVGDNGSSLTVDGRSGSPVVTFTRPADTTPYGAADVIGSASTANHEATNAGSSGSLVQILSAALTLNATSVPSGLTTVRLHIWDSAPAAIADNAVFAASAADRAKYCGFIDMASIQAIGGGFCWTQGDYIGRPVRLSGTSFFFNIAMTGAAGHTPASGIEFRVRFHCVEAGA